MKKLDYVIIIFLTLVSLISSGIILYTSSRANYEQEYVEISVKGELYKKISFNENTEETIDINTNIGVNTIKISKGEVQFIKANCPDKVCIKDGVIKKPGQSLVCLPNRIVVEIKGIEESETDDTAY